MRKGKRERGTGERKRNRKEEKGGRGRKNGVSNI
jgi:hypothetical protein